MSVMRYKKEDGTYGIVGFSPAESFPTLLKRKEWAQTAYSTLTEVRFVEDYKPSDYDEVWDAGVEPGTITAYREGNVLTVSANGKRKILMNAGSNGMFNSFYALRAIKGLEMLDASNVTSIGGMFTDCKELTEVDMSMWHLGAVTNASGVFYRCYNLRRVKMPHGLNCDALKQTFQMFDGCRKLVEVDLGNGPAVIGEKMFSKCINLERVTGLNGATSVGVRAFTYCAKLKDIDLNPAILTSIGEYAFCMSGIEDCINMDELNPDCEIGDNATRAKRWPDFKVLAAIQDKIVPTVALRVPHADSQKRYPDVKFGCRNLPGDDVEEPIDVYISTGGCSALSLYHEWQCIHHGTDLQKANFLEYWKPFEGDAFVNKNHPATMYDFFTPQAEILGWGHEEIYITSDEQFDVILERLENRLPTCVIRHSAGSSDGYHAVVVVGGDTLSGKLLVVDSAFSYPEQAEFVWVKFEDMFTAAGDDHDRLAVHTFNT